MEENKNEKLLEGKMSYRIILEQQEDPEVYKWRASYQETNANRLIAFCDVERALQGMLEVQRQAKGPGSKMTKQEAKEVQMAITLITKYKNTLASHIIDMYKDAVPESEKKIKVISANTKIPNLKVN